MNLFVGNLNPETTADSLRTLFSEFGVVLSSKIIIDKTTGMSRGFGFVEIEDKFHSYDCIDNLDSIFFEGNVISVKEAKGTTGGSGGGNSRPQQKRTFKPRIPRREFPPREDNFNSTRY